MWVTGQNPLPVTSSYDATYRLRPNRYFYHPSLGGARSVIPGEVSSRPNTAPGVYDSGRPPSSPRQTVINAQDMELLDVHSSTGQYGNLSSFTYGVSNGLL